MHVSVAQRSTYHVMRRVGRLVHLSGYLWSSEGRRAVLDPACTLSWGKRHFSITSTCYISQTCLLIYLYVRGVLGARAGH